MRFWRRWWDSPSAAASPCILPGLAWSARLFCLKTVYHTVFFTAKPSRVRIPLVYHIKKTTTRMGGCFSGGDGGIRTHVPAQHRQNDFESLSLRPLRYISISNYLIINNFFVKINSNKSDLLRFDTVHKTVAIISIYMSIIYADI